MHITHKVHIRGPHSRVFFSCENQSNPLFARLRFFLFRGFYVFFFFFHGGKKITGKKQRHSPHRIDNVEHADSVCLRNQHGFLTTIILVGMIVFLLLGMGLTKKCFEREIEREREGFVV